MSQQSESTTVAPVDDEHIHCPQCDYNLTGLEGDVCPECGRKFQHEDLKWFAGNRPQLVRPWDQRTLVTLPVAFARTCLTTWFTPGAFAKHFPARHSVASAWTFSTLCYVAALAIPMITAFEHSVREVYIIWFLLAVPAGAIGCESGLALLFSQLLQANHLLPRQSSYHFYRGLTHYMSNYLILSGIACRLSLKDEGLFWCLFAVIVLWWWLSLGKAVLLRSKQSAACVVAVLAIPVGAAVGAAVGVFFGFVVGGCSARVFGHIAESF